MVERLTQRRIALAVERHRASGRDFVLWDAETPGLGLRLRSGCGVWVVRARVGDAPRPRWVRLGRLGALTLEQVRRAARREAGRCALGIDPNAERREQRLAGVPVGALLERYLAEVSAKKKSSANDHSLVKRHLGPALGRCALGALTRGDVERFHAKLSETQPVNANRAVALLSHAYTLAGRWGLFRGTSPTRGVERNRERSRTRFLGSADLAALGEAIARAERNGKATAIEAAAIRLIALTGMRRGEVLKLTWAEVDAEPGALHLTDSKTGPKRIELNAAAEQLLAAQPRSEGCELVFPGSDGAAMRNLDKPWKWIREAARFGEDVTLHTLRHSFVSSGLNAGLSLAVLGGLVGHSTPSMTARYGHFERGALREATERIGERIVTALDGKPLARVVPLSEARS